jgi:hypothetical protein
MMDFIDIYVQSKERSLKLFPHKQPHKTYTGTICAVKEGYWSGTNWVVARFVLIDIIEFALKTKVS